MTYGLNGMSERACIFLRKRVTRPEIRYLPSEILLMLQGRRSSDESSISRRHQEGDGEAPERLDMWDVTDLWRTKRTVHR